MLQPSRRLRAEQAWLATGSLVLLAGVALAGILYFMRPVALPFVLAFMLFSLVSPVVNLLIVYVRLPRFFAVMIAWLLVLVLIGVLVLVLVEALHAVYATVRQYSDSLAFTAQRVIDQLGEWGFEIEQTTLVDDLRRRVPTLVTQSFAPALNIASTTFLIVIFVLFMLAGRQPNTARPAIYNEIDHKIRRYIATKIAVSIATGLLVWLILSWFGLELAGVFGMLAFLLNFVPSIGSIIATVLPLPIAIVQFDSAWSIFGVLLIPGAIQITIGNFIDPKLMGYGLQLHPVTILVSLTFWGLLWGPVGMILAVPITAIVRIVLMHFDTLKPLGNLLAGQLPELTFDDEPNSSAKK